MPLKQYIIDDPKTEAIEEPKSRVLLESADAPPAVGRSAAAAWYRIHTARDRIEVLRAGNPEDKIKPLRDIVESLQSLESTLKGLNKNVLEARSLKHPFDVTLFDLVPPVLGDEITAILGTMFMDYVRNMNPFTYMPEEDELVSRGNTPFAYRRRLSDMIKGGRMDPNSVLVGLMKLVFPEEPEISFAEEIKAEVNVVEPQFLAVSGIDGIVIGGPGNDPEGIVLDLRAEPVFTLKMALKDLPVSPYEGYREIIQEAIANLNEAQHNINQTTDAKEKEALGVALRDARRELDELRELLPKEPGPG